MTHTQTNEAIRKEFEEKLVGENGWLIDNPDERCKEITDFLLSKLHQQRENLEKEAKEYGHQQYALGQSEAIAYKKEL